MNRKTRTMAAVALAAGVVYAYTNPLQKEVVSGEVTLDPSELAGYDALEKTGAGTLILPDITSFSGDIVIKAGIAKTSVEGGLGDTTGKTVVEAGAQLYIDSPSSDLDFSGETMEIASQNGSTAIYLNNKSDNEKNLGSVKLTADAKIHFANQYSFNSGKTCDLDGHTITFKSSGPSVYLWLSGTYTAGNIVADNIRCFLRGSATFQGDASNTFTLGTSAVASFFQFSGSIPWTLKPNATGSNLEIRYKDGLSGERNIWSGPIDLSSKGLILTRGYNVGACGMTLAGKISGSNGLKTGGADYRNFTAFITNPANDFEGGVAFAESTLNLPVSGALPTNGGELSMMNGTVVLTNELAYALPSATFDGTGLVHGVTATGTWKDRLAKTGDGTLLYNTCIGASVLDLCGGTFKMSVERVTVITNRTPGIYGGSCAYETSSAAQTAWSGSETFTNGTVYLSPTMAYKAGTDQGWTANTLWTYRGTIWNRSPTNEMWTFARCILARGKVLLDGNSVVLNESPASDKSWGGVKQGTVEVSPGSHTIEIRLQSATVTTSAYSGGGAYYNSTVLPAAHGSEAGYTWAGSSGIMLDRLGRGSHDVADYKKIIDSGDGDLLTLTDTEDTVIRHRPVFDTVVATNGVATLDMNGSDYAVRNLVGFPSVVNCGTFSVTNDWRLTALGTATFDGAVEFADGTTLTIDGIERPSAESEWTILTAADGMTGLPAVVSDTVRGSWSVAVDGAALKLAYRPKGFRFIVR